MPASIGVNLRVTGHCRQGGRKYMEDFFSVAYQQTQDEKDLEYAFFGIFDGHGGMEAATFAKEHLMESIVRQKNFWSDKDEDVLKAIKDGYINTHYAMWREQEKWPKTASGLPSTAGTTASVAFIRRGKIYIGHVGDSGIILGYQEPGNPIWQAKPLTEDHKPENKSEMSRIEQSGGKVVTKSGVPRVVWNRPRIGHKGPVRRSTPIDEIPFLAVARSLGDLWSYNSALDEFVVSPDPDTVCIPINADTFRCLIFGTDGLWNMISPASAVTIVQFAEQHNERTVLAAADSEDVAAAAGRANKVWINPSKCLVERALERWSNTRMRADNTSVITLMLDPPGPPRAEVIKNQRLLENRQRQQQQQQQQQLVQQNILDVPEDDCQGATPEYPETGLEILTMYEDPPMPTYPENSHFVPLIGGCADKSIEPQFSENVQPSSVVEDYHSNSYEGIKTTNKIVDHIVPEQVQQSDQIMKHNKPEKISERRLTEENLNKIHRQVLNDMHNYVQTEEIKNDQIAEENTRIIETTMKGNTKAATINQISTSDTNSKTTRLKNQKCLEHLQEFCKQCSTKLNDHNTTKEKYKEKKDKKGEAREVLNDNDKLPKQTKTKTDINETIIQINEVSSSSPDKLLNEDDNIPCSRCTRSQDHTNKSKSPNRKSLRTTTTNNNNNTKVVTSLSTKSINNFNSNNNNNSSTTNKQQKLTKLSNRSNSTSPLPRRKTRSSIIKNVPLNSGKTFGPSKREHSDPDLKGDGTAAAAAATVDSTRQTTNNIIEPPQKLRRSQSLGPRDFTLRSMTQLKVERCLRDRNGSSLSALGNRNATIYGRNSLVTLSAGSSTTYKKISSAGKNFTPVKQAIQTRNRVKRLNK